MVLLSGRDFRANENEEREKKASVGEDRQGLLLFVQVFMDNGMLS